MARAAGSLYPVQTARVVLHAGKATAVTIPALQGITLPQGVDVTETVATQLNVAIDKVFGSGAQYQPISFDAYWTKQDPTRQEIDQARVNGTGFSDMRFYADACDFSALDLIADATGVYGIGTNEAPSGAKSEIITTSLTILPGGISLFFDTHKSGSTIATTASGAPGSPATITDSANGFVTAGFEAGMTLYLDEVDGNDPFIVRIDTVTAGLITLEEDVGDEDSIPAFSFTSTLGKVHGANPITIDLTVDCG